MQLFSENFYFIKSLINSVIHPPKYLRDHYVPGYSHCPPPKKNPLIKQSLYDLATDTTNTQMNMEKDSVCAKC